MPNSALPSPPSHGRPGHQRSRKGNLSSPIFLFFALPARRSCGSEGGATCFPPLLPPRAVPPGHLPPPRRVLCSGQHRQGSPCSLSSLLLVVLAPCRLAPSPAGRHVFILETEDWIGIKRVQAVQRPSQAWALSTLPSQTVHFIKIVLPTPLLPPWKLEGITSRCLLGAWVSQTALPSGASHNLVRMARRERSYNLIYVVGQSAVRMQARDVSWVTEISWEARCVYKEKKKIRNLLLK